MAAYVIALVRTLSDRSGMEDYWAAVAPIIKDSGAKRISAYMPFEHLEGEAPLRAVSILEFPSAEQARNFYSSPGYAAARAKREGAAEFESILVEEGAVALEDRLR